MIPELFITAILVLLGGPLLSFALSSRDERVVKTVALGSAIIAALSLFTLLTGQNSAFTVYQPFPYLALSFFIDRLAAFFLLLIAVIGGCVVVYTVEYFEHLGGGARRNLLCAFENLFILAMVLVVASAITISFLLFWELMAASSFFLVMCGYTQEETRKAGVFYFIMTKLSTLFVMTGIFALYVQTGSFAIAPLTAAGSPLITIAFLALFVGFAIKAGIISFHKWLPYAHPASPSPILALFSGVMLKIAVYGLIRFLLDVFQLDIWWGVLILAAGTASAVLGIIYALKEHDVKARLAYSNIENVGIVFLGSGFSIILSATDLPLLATISLLGALFHALNHALFKALLFLTSGSVVHAIHTRDIEHMGGLAHRMPWTSGLFFIGAVPISPLPPFNGFASELMIFSAFFSSTQAVPTFLLFSGAPSNSYSDNTCRSDRSRSPAAIKGFIRPDRQ